MPQPGPIWASCVAYTTAHCKLDPLTHWARPGIKPVSSWIPVTLVSTESCWELLFQNSLPVYPHKFMGNDSSLSTRLIPLYGPQGRQKRAPGVCPPLAEPWHPSNSVLGFFSEPKKGLICKVWDIWAAADAKRIFQQGEKREMVLVEVDLIYSISR